MDTVIAHLKGQLEIAVNALVDIQGRVQSSCAASLIIRADNAIQALTKNPEPPLWQPIATAPLDRMVLTDCGCAIYQDHKDTAFWMCKPGWFTCTPEGNVYEDADDGIIGQRCDPTLWMEFPALPTKEG